MEDFSQMVQDVLDGNESPYRALGIMNMVMKDLQAKIDIVKEIALEDSLKYDKKFYSDGFDIERREGGRMWDFKSIPEWNEAKDRLIEVESKYKALADAYGKFKGVQVATEDGEETIMPKVTYRKDSLILKEAK